MPVARVNDSLLSVFERPTLAWMARRVPANVTPDHLTIIGLTGAVAAAAGFVASRWSLQFLWLAAAGLVINWAGDSLDGNVARLRGIERHRYGFFVDHTTDLFSQALIFIALAISPCARFGIAALALITFLMAFVYTLIYVRAEGTMRITYFRFGPTEIRALLVIGNLMAVASPDVLDITHRWTFLRPFAPVTLYEVVIAAICAITVPALALLAFRESRVLGRLDPPPAGLAAPVAPVPTPAEIHEPAFAPAVAAIAVTSAADGV